MANLKEIRTRVASVKSTKQITSAMKMVSAAKLRRAQDTIIQMRPYANKLNEILSVINDPEETDVQSPYLENREAEKILLVAITSNKGLCGGFNNSVTKLLVDLLKTDYKTQYEKGNLDIITIGKKANDFLRTRKIKIKESFTDIYDELTFEKVLSIVNPAMQSFVDKQYDRIDLVYNRFKNAAVHILTHEQLLPVILLKEEDEDKSIPVDYILEPSKEYIIKQLIPKSLRIQFYEALLDSHAAEQGARMTAMHKATDNATELIKDLQLSYNKARQASITNEILEIVGGANALKG